MDSIENNKKNIIEDTNNSPENKENILITREAIITQEQQLVSEMENIDENFLNEDKKLQEIPDSLKLPQDIVEDVKQEMQVDQAIREINTQERSFKSHIMGQLKNIRDSLNNLRGKLVERSMTPIGYDPLKPLSVPGELLLPKMEAKTWATKNRYDAWAIYNGQPQHYESFRKNPDGTYKIKSFNIDEKKFKKIIQDPREKIGIDINFGGVSGASWAIKGFDDKGKFVDFTDEWDLQPLKTQNYLPEKVKNFEVSSLSGGAPFTTVNKVYYDENGNLFDDDAKTPLVKSTEPVTFEANEGMKTEDVTYYKTQDIQDVSQNEILKDWDSHQSYGFAKSMVAPAFAISLFAGINVIEQEKMNTRIEEFSKKKNFTIEQSYDYLANHPAEADSLVNYEDFVKNLPDESNVIK
jgi:hypothetical protein